jgi:predicted ATP-binding protein involved in virulence
MENKLVFRKIEKESIFCEPFNNLVTNNEIEFSNNGIAVIYGPNGTGKTSLANVLNSEEMCSFEVEYNTQQFNEENTELFHIINDQNSRNIIAGETEDFLLGDNIRKEYELQRYLENEFTNLFENVLIGNLKKEFNISKKSSELLKHVTDPTLIEYISDLTNNKSKGRGINKDEFLEFVSTLEVKPIPNYDEKNMNILKMTLKKKTRF